MMNSGFIAAAMMGAVMAGYDVPRRPRGPGVCERCQSAETRVRSTCGQRRNCLCTKCGHQWAIGEVEKKTRNP